MMPAEIEIRARIENSRKELLDLSLRNPLLNYRPLTARGVEIVSEKSQQVFCDNSERKEEHDFPAHC